MESAFDCRYENAVGNRVVSPEIELLLRRLDGCVIARPWNLPALKDALIELLSFLVSVEGRTDGNCRAVDLFVALSWGEGWPNWQELPKPFEAIIFDIGGQLHDTFGAPEIARNYESLPEQLLDRAQSLEVDE